MFAVPTSTDRDDGVVLELRTGFKVRGYTAGTRAEYIAGCMPPVERSVLA